MEIVNDNIYNYPKYYDLVYGSDWKAEFNFLSDCIDEYCRTKSPRLLEPACGTGRLVYRFAKAGFDICGLDLNEKAIKLYKDSVTIYSCKLGEDNDRTLAAKTRLAAILSNAGHLDEAIDMFHMVTTMQRALLGEMSPSVADGHVQVVRQ